MKGVLERLFTSNVRVKVLGYFFFNKKESYLREISKDLGISPSAIKREVENLCSVGLLKNEGGKIFLDDSYELAGILKDLFIKTDYVSYPIREVFAKLRVDFVVLFGSFVKGKYHSESDIDLLIIGEIKQSEVFKKLKNLEKKIEREINPIVWDLEELKKNKNKSIVREILKKNIFIIGDVNEFQKIVR